MKIENILEAETEAKRFLLRIKELKNSEYVNRDVFNGMKDKFGNLQRTNSSKETGALKRASMDLTRSLSKLRNNTW